MCALALCACVSGNQEEPPGRVIVSVCACAQSPGKEEPDPTPGEREENFYVGPPRLVADVPKLEVSKLKVFREKSASAAITKRTGSAARVRVSV